MHHLSQCNHGAYYELFAQGPLISFTINAKNNKKQNNTIKQDFYLFKMYREVLLSPLQLYCFQEWKTERILHRKDLTFSSKMLITQKVMKIGTCNLHTIITVCKDVFWVILRSVCWIVLWWSGERKLHKEILNQFILYV